MAAFNESGGHCLSCASNVLVRRKGTNHILHLFLSVFSMGFWLPIWLLASVRIGGWRCTKCGQPAKRT